MLVKSGDSNNTLLLKKRVNNMLCKRKKIKMYQANMKQKRNNIVILYLTNII